MDAMAGLISERGGLAAAHELLAAGHSRAEIARAVRTRRIFRVRQGWYARPGTDRILLAAARVGGRATCISGLSVQGFWTPPDPRLHVACPPHHARLRRPTDSRRRLDPADRVRVHWRPLPAEEPRLFAGPLECLRDALSCSDPTSLTIAADSVLFARPGLRASWRGFCESVPATHRTALGLADGVCESGLESLTWLRIRTLPAGVRRQVPIPGVGRVDFVVGDRLVLEVDGAAYHTDPRQFEDDRCRDARLAARGFRVLRFSFRQVTERWHEVDAAISAVVARGDHLTRP